MMYELKMNKTIVYGKDTIINNFKNFKDTHGNDAFKKLNDFFAMEEKKFYTFKIKELEQMNIPKNDVIKKARQSWIYTIGKNLEDIVKLMLTDFCKQYNLYITDDRELRKKYLPKELQQVKKILSINYNNREFLPDGDIIIYKKIFNIPKIIAILSVKNSFRERYLETSYWKVKLAKKYTTRNIKLLMITPDKDNELSKSYTKCRQVLEYELDGIYLAKDKFLRSNKVKSIDDLINDLRAIL